MKKLKLKAELKYENKQKMIMGSCGITTSTNIKMRENFSFLQAWCVGGVPYEDTPWVYQPTHPTQPLLVSAGNPWSTSNRTARATYVVAFVYRVFSSSPIDGVVVLLEWRWMCCGGSPPGGGDGDFLEAGASLSLYRRLQLVLGFQPPSASDRWVAPSRKVHRLTSRTPKTTSMVISTVTCGRTGGHYPSWRCFGVLVAISSNELRFWRSWARWTLMNETHSSGNSSSFFSSWKNGHFPRHLPCVWCFSLVSFHHYLSIVPPTHKIGTRENEKSKIPIKT